MRDEGSSAPAQSDGHTQIEEHLLAVERWPRNHACLRRQRCDRCWPGTAIAHWCASVSRQQWDRQGRVRRVRRRTGIPLPASLFEDIEPTCRPPRLTYGRLTSVSGAVEARAYRDFPVALCSSVTRVFANPAPNGWRANPPEISAFYYRPIGGAGLLGATDKGCPVAVVDLRHAGHPAGTRGVPQIWSVPLVQRAPSRQLDIAWTPVETEVMGMLARPAFRNLGRGVF